MARTSEGHTESFSLLLLLHDATWDGNIESILEEFTLDVAGYDDEADGIKLGLLMNDKFVKLPNSIDWLDNTASERFAKADHELLFSITKVGEVEFNIFVIVEGA